MTKLSVNINKIAVIRNARGGNVPDVIQAAKDCERFGADGITVHPRPDGRHIRKDDVYKLRDVITTEFNIEGYPSKSFLDMILEVVPEQVTLVPDPPNAITSNNGWDIINNFDFLVDVIQKIKKKPIRVSIFVNPEVSTIEAASKTGTDRIELYTEPYASGYKYNRNSAIEPYLIAASKAKELGLGINAGHDLNLENLEFFNKQIPFIDEVSIGHALISDALYFGLENTISMYKSKLVR
ncbi:MAG: pyridoxine 5'-phosphate synthase [Bacteroidales bacterium]